MGTIETLEHAFIETDVGAHTIAALAEPALAVRSAHNAVSE